MKKQKVKINRNLVLDSDGKLYNIKTGEEFIPVHGRQGYITSIRRKCYFVHQLVMQYFGPPKPGSEYVILHKNKNNLDNRIENLEWGTAKDASARRKGSLPLGHRKCDLSEKEYRRERSKANYDNNYPEYYSKNRERIVEKSRKWRQNNPEKVKDTNKRYYQSHKEECNKANADWYRNNADYVNEKRRKDYATEPEKYLQRNKKWARNNPEKKKEMDRRHAVKRKNYLKQKSTEWQKAHPEKVKEHRHNYYLRNKDKIKARRRTYSLLK